MTIIEAVGSRTAERSRQDASYELLHYIVGEGDDDQVVASLYNGSLSPTYQGLILQKFSVEQLAIGIWKGKATYGLPTSEQSQARPEVGEFSFSFDTSGGRQKITATDKDKVRATGLPGFLPPDQDGAINVVNGKDVQGVEIIVPALTFEVATKIPGGTLTANYAIQLAEATGKTNKNPFLGCAAGTLLLEGVSGGFKVGANIERELRFKFAYSPNKENFKIGQINVPLKRGWEYLWVHFQRLTDQNQFVQVPRAVYVHPIYEECDFAQELGFG